MVLTVATYNIAAGLSNGYFKKKDYFKSAEVIKSINADVITLNEVGKHLPSFIKEHASFLAGYCGYKYFSFAKATMFGRFPYGNAILSKYPLSNVTVIPVRKFARSIPGVTVPGIYEPRCILCADIECGSAVRVICTHLGLFPDEQKDGLRAVAKELAKRDIPTIFMGDLNINDMKESNVRITPMKKLLTDVCDNSKILTYPAKKPKKRLDYIFISDTIDVDDVFAFRSTASDHLPLVARVTVT